MKPSQRCVNKFMFVEFLHQHSKYKISLIFWPALVVHRVKNSCSQGSLDVVLRSSYYPVDNPCQHSVFSLYPYDFVC